MAWEESVTEVAAWLDGFGLIGLGILTFTEAIIQPIPPDILTLPMYLAADSAFRIFLIWLVATVTSVSGACIGYYIGKKAGRGILDKVSKGGAVEKIEVLVDRYGVFGIFIAAISPIPYKVFAWVAGMGEMDLRLFVTASVIGRGLRFGIQAVAIGLYGESILRWLTPLNFLLLGVFGALLLIPANRWWQNLSHSVSDAE
jgi:membrane protein YqaA with SNARE-associated domain